MDPKPGLLAALWIRDILVRIQIRGPVPLTFGYGFGSGSFSCRHWPSRCQLFYFIFLFYFFRVFLFITFWRYINIIKKSQYSTYKSRFFLLFLLDDGWIQIRIRTHNDGSGSGGYQGTGSTTLPIFRLVGFEPGAKLFNRKKYRYFSGNFISSNGKICLDNVVNFKQKPLLQPYVALFILLGLILEKDLG